MNIKQTFIRNFPRAYEAITSSTGLTPKNRAQGVDVYGRYQGYFRPETATQRIDFAIQKLTEGITIKDLKMDEIWSGVKQIGMQGAYHYQRSGVSWRDQANYFLDFASKYDHHFYADDLEKINNVLNDSFAADMYRIIHHWKEQAPAKKIILYSNKDLFETFIFPRIKALYGGLGLTWLIENVNIWYAQYWNTPSVDKDPALPTWMKTWRIWQITDKALYPLAGADWGMGSKGGDIDVYNGTPDEMRAWLGLASQPAPEPVPPPPIVVEPTEPPVEPQLYNAEVIADLRRIIRSYPKVDTSNATGLYVLKGTKFQGRIWAGNAYVWLKIDAPQYPDLHKRWVAVRTLDGTSKYIKLATPIVSPHKLYRLLKWGDPIMLKEGLSISIVGTTNFQAIGMYNKVQGWGGVTNYLDIPRVDIDRLIAMQVEDEYEDKQPDWRSQKMNWLCKGRGTIYFHDESGQGWDIARFIRWGTIGIGNNVVAVEGVEEMVINTRGDTEKRPRKMARLAGFRRSDWSRPLNELLENGLVHRCYCAYAGDKLGDSPKGIIYSPFWSPLDWQFIGPSKAQPLAFYLCLDWMVPA